MMRSSDELTTIFGVHDHRSYASTKQVFPKTVHVREFVSGELSTSSDLVGKINRLAAPAFSAGLIPWISFKLRPSDVAAGRWDAKLRAVGAEVDSRVRLIPYHEPEDDMSPSRFTAMFNRVATRVKSAARGHRLVYSAMAYQFRPGSSTTADPAAWFPTGADVYAADVYSGRSEPLTAILPDHPGFKRWNRYRPKTKPWAVTERGFITGSRFRERADQIAREAAWLKTSGCAVYIYWNSEGTEGDPAILLDARYGEPALRAMMASQ